MLPKDRPLRSRPIHGKEELSVRRAPVPGVFEFVHGNEFDRGLVGSGKNASHKTSIHRTDVDLGDSLAERKGANRGEMDSSCNVCATLRRQRGGRGARQV
jgi:hypothetical protein